MGDLQHAHLALLRFSGEIGTKARSTRLQFRRRLLQNLRDALAAHGLVAVIDSTHERIFVELEDGLAASEPEPLRDHPLTRIFGIQSVSCVERRAVTRLPDIVAAGVELFEERVRGRRFAVRARRVGSRRQGAVRSGEIHQALGAALLPGSAGVDLDTPEVRVQIELSDEATAFFSDRTPGPGGLPLGIEGAAVALLSGGFDSAVAAWLMLKRGVALDYVFCRLGGPAHLHDVLPVAKSLADRWSYGDRPRLHVIDFEPVVEALQADTAKRYWQILLKRMMLRAAEAVGRRGRAAAIVTGEAVGQVSSQTLQNLTVISRATSESVLRPLVGFNKEEIIALAERIGTFELSKGAREYCALVPRHPATRASLEAVEREEARLDPGVLAHAVATRSDFDLRSLELGALDRPDLAIDRVPEKAVVIDLRPLAQYRSGHHPEALHLDIARALALLPALDRNAVYVVSCAYGLQSAQLAAQMRRAGLQAFYIRGGQRALERSAH